MKKKLHEYAKKIGLNFVIEGPMKRTDFLDIAFDMQNGTYAPFRKKNNEVKYVHTESNHPKTILRQIPKMVSKRLSNRSINKDEFDKISGEYNNALAKSGYKEKILYETKTVKNHDDFT